MVDSDNNLIKESLESATRPLFLLASIDDEEDDPEKRCSEIDSLKDYGVFDEIFRNLKPSS